MSIIITNVSIKNNPFGECDYEVRINKDVVATFKHNRPDGLAKCLKLAAEAVEEQNWITAMEFATSIKGVNND